MSFILDALRKSEHDRQREKGPGLAEVAVSPPKPKKNVWATVAVGLLVINLVAVGVLLLRRAGEHSNAGASNATAPGSATNDVNAPQPTREAPVAAVPSAAPANPRAVPGAVPPVLQPALPADEAGGTHNPLADELSGSAAGDENYEAGYDGGYPVESAPYPTAPPGMSGPPSKRGSVVYENLPEADPVTSPSHAATNAAAAAAASDASRAAGRGSSLPTLDDLGGQTGLPELRVELHVYSTKPQERIVFINSRSYKEGDTLQEGPRVDRITPDGAELSYRGNRFMLPRQ
jgi:general secretion pathway protein B